MFSLMPEKKINLCSASRMTFRAWFYRTDHFRAFWETLFESEQAKESPEIYFRAKSFRTIFEKRAPVYSLEAPLLGMAKVYILRPRSENVFGTAHERYGV